jgi:hypothetical protein
MPLDRFLVVEGGWEGKFDVLVGVMGKTATFEERFCNAEREL